MKIEKIAADVAAQTEMSSGRIQTALRKACRVIHERCESHVNADDACDDFLEAFAQCGASVLLGAHPQLMEDELYRVKVGSFLTEALLRRGWLEVFDELNRTGDAPQQFTQVQLEHWLESAASCSMPHIDLDQHIDAVLSKLGRGQQVVLVSGPGRSSFLAALRRRLLSGDEACYVPPVVSAARDDASILIRPSAFPGQIDSALESAIPQLQFDEDRVGICGRLGVHFASVLLLDDAEFCSRTYLHGLPVFLEPDDQRNALLVCAVAHGGQHLGPLEEVLIDADSRGILTRVELPNLNAEHATALFSAIVTDVVDAEVGELISRVSLSHGGESLRWAAARSWCNDLLQLDASKRVAYLKDGFGSSDWMPKHPVLTTLLSVAAVEGVQFHGAALARVIDKTEEVVEDLIQDEDFEHEGERTGGCLDAVPIRLASWQALPDGAQACYRFGDVRYVLSLTEGMEQKRLKTVARALLDSLWQLHGPAQLWQSLSQFRRLATSVNAVHQLQRGIIARHTPDRVETSFRRLLPVLQAEKVYHLGLARLHGAAVEFGSLATQLGRVAEADQAFQAAAAAAERLQRPGPAGEAMAKLGEIRLALALPDPAHAALDVAEALLKKAGSESSLNRILLLRAEVAVLEGDLSAGVEQLSDAVDRLTASKDVSHAALALMRRGRIRYEMGQVNESVNDLEQAMTISKDAGDPRAHAAACAARGFIHSEADELTEAFVLLNTAAECFQRIGMPVTVLETVAADLQRRHDQAEDALKRFNAVSEQFKKARAAIQWADAQHGAARCLIALEKASDAVVLLDEVEKLRVRARDRFGLVRVYLDQALARESADDVTTAFKYACMARVLVEHNQMNLHHDFATQQVVRLAPKLDGLADVTARDLARQAEEAVDAVEAIWKAPPQPSEPSKELH